MRLEGQGQSAALGAEREWKATGPPGGEDRTWRSLRRRGGDSAAGGEGRGPKHRGKTGEKWAEQEGAGTA